MLSICVSCGAVVTPRRPTARIQRQTGLLLLRPRSRARGVLPTRVAEERAEPHRDGVLVQVTRDDVCTNATRHAARPATVEPLFDLACTHQAPNGRRRQVSAT